MSDHGHQAHSPGRGARTRRGYGMADFRTRGHVSPKDLPPLANQAAKSGAFSVLIAVHRPRYRGRAQRAAAVPDWRVRSLLNKEDPIGILNQKPPYSVFVISDDFGRQKGLGILRAAQRFRESGLRVIGLLTEPDSAEAARGLCDEALAPPWRTADLRAILERLYEELTGKPVNVSDLSDKSDTSDKPD